MKKLPVWLLAAIFFSANLYSPSAKADTAKEFTTSVIYGTLAGTLVGAATLAFTSNPGDNLNNVARGASYGLYAGILLGLYVAYGVGDDSAPPTQEEIRPDQNIYEGSPPPLTPGGGGPQGSFKIENPPAKPAVDRALIAISPIAPSLTGRAGDWGVEAAILNVRF